VLGVSGFGTIAGFTIGGVVVPGTVPGNVLGIVSTVLGVGSGSPGGNVSWMPPSGGVGSVLMFNGGIGCVGLTRTGTV
jgi:hypothetical protein